MTQQIKVAPSAVAAAGDAADVAHEVLGDVAVLRTAIVNVVMIGPAAAGDRGWVLIDAGITGSASLIQAAAARRFGVDARPAAIVMTHGHFDHVGALETLADAWDVPVYAHALERPYLDGSAAYPPGDPTVGGGLMALLSPLYPTAPVDVANRLRVLPDDGTIPPLPAWRWLPTPGHSPGHVSFWREADRTLVAGDAVVTTAQESAYAVATQAAELHGPPMYFTIDWIAAAASTRALAALEPETLVTGHGLPLKGEAMRDALRILASTFESTAVPAGSHYVEHPALAADGTAYRKP